MLRMDRVLRSGVLLALGATMPAWASAAPSAFDANQATCQYYSLSERIAWSRPGGDWFDKTGTTFGLASFASEKVPVIHGEQLIHWDITALASRWQAGGDGAVGAVYVKAMEEGPGIVNFASAKTPDTSMRPALDLVWDDGRAIRVAPSSDTYFSCPTHRALGGTATLQVSSNESALLVFSIALRPGHSIRRATLILATNKQYSRASVVGVFGVRLPPRVASMNVATAAKASVVRLKSASDEREPFPPPTRATPSPAVPPAAPTTSPTTPPIASIGNPDADWLARSHASGVVIAVGFDDIHDWAKYNWDRENCMPAYQVVLDGKKVGCRSNSWDPKVRASGKGSVRFDILSKSVQGGAGDIAIPFGDFNSAQFGANTDLWVSWRQRMDPRFIQGYKAQGGGFANAKQIILAQGDVPTGNPAHPYLSANACSEAELVIVGSSPAYLPTYPEGYIECGRYNAFEQKLSAGQYAGVSGGSTFHTYQNMRANALGQSDCVGFPAGKDQTGCFTYVADEWTTYMVHLKIGSEGTAVSSVNKVKQPGYINSTYDFYAAHPGQDFQLLHHQTGVVIPKGQYYVSGNPLLASSYKGGWDANSGYLHAKYGKLWLTPYMTNKDATQVTQTASTWYDEVIVSRCKIAAPGFPAPSVCNPSNDILSPITGTATVAPTPRPAPPPTPDPPPGSPAMVIPAPWTGVPAVIATGVTGTQLVAALKALPPGQWLDVPNSQMAGVQVDACQDATIKAAYQRIGPPGATCNPNYITAYSGGAYDSNAHRLLIFGGGHTGYDGNEIYAFNVAAGTWQRLTEPAPPALDRLYDPTTRTYSVVSPQWVAPGYPPLPVSVHSYDQLVYLPDQNALFAAGGATYSGNGYVTNGTWMFDLTRSDYSGWTQVQAMPGKPYDLYEYNMDTAYDPLSHKVIMRGYSKAGAFDPATRIWTVFPSFLPTRTLNTVGALDPKRRMFVVIGFGTAQVYAVASNDALGQPLPLAATGATDIEKCRDPGFEYDSAADRFVAWCGGGDVYTLDMDSRIWTKHSAPVGATVPGAALSAGTYGRFAYMPEYDAFILVNDNRQNVFFYRLANGG